MKGLAAATATGRMRRLLQQQPTIAYSQVGQVSACTSEQTTLTTHVDCSVNNSLADGAQQPQPNPVPPPPNPVPPTQVAAAPAPVPNPNPAPVMTHAPAYQFAPAPPAYRYAPAPAYRYAPAPAQAQPAYISTPGAGMKHSSCQCSSKKKELSLGLHPADVIVVQGAPCSGNLLCG
eukprot:1145952-Pelagomonas_calceolata.AAC.1